MQRDNLGVAVIGCGRIGTLRASLTPAPTLNPCRDPMGVESLPSVSLAGP